MSTASVANRPASFAGMFTDRVAATPDTEAFRYPKGDGSWASLTWKQTKERVFDLAAGLVALGVEVEQRVAIASTTRLEWILADLAISCAGAATTTVYPATTEGDVQFILSDSDSKVVFAEDAGQVEKIKAANLPGLLAIVVFDGASTGDGVIDLNQLAEKGAALRADQPSVIDDRIAQLGPENLATLIYTSGTTGRPKGVRLVQANWTYEGVAIDALDILRPSDVHYLWLPLSHVFGKVLLVAQWQVGFATAVDGNLDRIVENMATIKPTVMAGAPRIFEKVRAKVSLTIEQEGGLKAKIFGWAFKVGIKASQDRQAGRNSGIWHKGQLTVADTLVFGKIRERLGGRIRVLVSGSAALSRDVAEWFDAAGLNLIEGYGLTETSAATFVSPPAAKRIGTVGPPLPGTEAIIAADGEVLVRGGGVMRGYHNNTQATEEVLTADGWFHTGDIGEIDGDGNLRITDRKKDLIKTSGGKYVAPQKVEVIFKAVCPYVSQIVVHGDGRKFVSALITLDEEAIVGWAQHNQMASHSYAELATSPEVNTLISGYVDELNHRLERWETIKKFVILDHDLTVESGGVTPSMKVRRKAVEKQYSETLDTLYDD
jgi:long-chain acyl-CoA synthetase